MSANLLSLVTVNLCRGVSNLSSSLCSLAVIALDIAAASHKVLDLLMGASRAARLRGQHLALLVHHENTASCALRCLFETNCGDECLRRVTQQAVR